MLSEFQSMKILGFHLNFLLLPLIQLVIISVCYGLARMSFNRLLRSMKRKNALANDILLKAERPANWMINILFVMTLTQALLAKVLIDWHISLSHILFLASLGIFCSFLYSLSFTLEEHLTKEHQFEPTLSPKLDVTAIQSLAKIGRLLIITFFILAVLPEIGFETTGLLTFGAASSVVLGLASKDLLANVFGGFMIFIDKPFGVGDWIKCPEKGIEGTVMSIGWRLTCIRNFERRPVYVPNSFFVQATVENPSRMENRRIKFFINLPYEDYTKIPTILNDIKAMIKSSHEVDASRPVYAHVSQLAPSTVECMVYCFVKHKDFEPFLDVQQTIMLNILGIIHKHESFYGMPGSKVFIQHVDQ